MLPDSGSILPTDLHVRRLVIAQCLKDCYQITYRPIDPFDAVAIDRDLRLKAEANIIVKIAHHLTPATGLILRCTRWVFCAKGSPPHIDKTALSGGNALHQGIHAPLGASHIGKVIAGADWARGQFADNLTLRRRLRHAV